MKKEQITKAIGTIGYDILDNFIGPALGISGIVADLYLADPATYADLEGEDKAVMEKAMKGIIKKYGLEDGNGEDFLVGYLIHMPIALIALYIMETGNYFKD